MTKLKRRNQEAGKAADMLSEKKPGIGLVDGILETYVPFSFRSLTKHLIIIEDFFEWWLVDTFLALGGREFPDRYTLPLASELSRPRDEDNNISRIYK